MTDGDEEDDGDLDLEKHFSTLPQAPREKILYPSTLTAKAATGKPKNTVVKPAVGTSVIRQGPGLALIKPTAAAAGKSKLMIG